MQLKRAFRSGFPPFLLPLIVGIAALGSSFVFSSCDSGPVERVGKNPAGPWSVEQTGSGLKIAWNLDAPLFQNSLGATLEINDGEFNREFDLDPHEKSGTIFYSPRTANCTLRLKIKGEPEKTEVIRLGSGAENDNRKAAAITPVLPPGQIPDGKGSRSRLETPPVVGTVDPNGPVPIRRVLAHAPPRLTHQLGREGLQVDVFVKIDWSGRVTAVHTREFGDRVRAELARIAANAAFQWRFRPLGGTDTRRYVEHVLHFKFART